MTIESKLRAGVAHYKREAEDAAHAVVGARSRGKREELVAEAVAAAWWRGRYEVLLEICESGKRPEELLAGYANRLPGRKVVEVLPVVHEPQPAPEPAPRREVRSPSPFVRATSLKRPVPTTAILVLGCLFAAGMALFR